MINALENAILDSDLDAQTFDILNCTELQGADNILYSSDSRMTDQRPPVAGIIDNLMVAENAGIVQSKLSLDGNMPTSWIGTTAGTAAEGDLVQFTADKDQPNGYVSLGLDGKLPTGSVPVAGVGTVKKIDFQFPHEFVVDRDVTTSDKSFTVYWTAPPLSWLGNASGEFAQPNFITDPMPLSLIPDLDASNFDIVFGGTFNPDRLPLAVGVGAEHAVGIIPVTNGFDGLPSDYLARDMTFKPMATPVSYQPTLPNPAITILYYAGPVAVVTITENVKGTNIFENHTADSVTFTQITRVPIQVPIGSTVMAYAAKIGYNNSDIVKYTIPDPARA